METSLESVITPQALLLASLTSPWATYSDSNSKTYLSQVLTFPQDPLPTCCSVWPAHFLNTLGLSATSATFP